MIGQNTQNEVSLERSIFEEAVVYQFTGTAELGGGAGGAHASPQ